MIYDLDLDALDQSFLVLCYEYLSGGISQYSDLEGAPDISVEAMKRALNSLVIVIVIVIINFIVMSLWFNAH